MNTFNNPFSVVDNVLKKYMSDESCEEKMKMK